MSITRRSRCLFASFLAVVLSTLCGAAWGGEPPAELEVVVASGRTFVGKVDATTSDASLVLRCGSERVWLQRTIGWESITAAYYGGEAVALDDLPAFAQRIATAAPERPSAAPKYATPGEPEPVAPPLPDPLATAVTFDAVLANWDADVETDGLVVYLQPIDGLGQLATVSGTVELELFAPQRRVFQDAPTSGGTSLEPLARWTTTVYPWQFTPAGAVLKFPFAAFHPEFRDDWGSFGLVHVRLTVPGSGVFEASRDAVRIRPWAPLRDKLQLNTGQRFLPTERTGRGKTSYSGGP